MKTKLLSAAGSILDRVLDVNPDNTEAHYHRACAYQAKRELKTAKKGFLWIREHSEDPYFKTAARAKLKRLQE